MAGARRGRDGRRDRGTEEGRRGRVVATRGRRVEVEGEQGAVHICFLAGHRAVVGDRVRWVRAQGTGGKVVAVEARDTALTRSDRDGRERVLAANLGGLLIVVASEHPPYRPGLVDRYQLAASVGGMRSAIVLNKTDLGVGDAVDDDLGFRADQGTPVFRVSAETGEGLEALAAFLAEDGQGAWALVGHSGVGKTSVVARLLPEQDVGPVGEISTFWDQGRHTTTGSKLFFVPGGGEIADSPGIRTFLPGRLAPETVRDHFPGMGGLGCRYRDCLHRDGEDGCVAPDEVAPEVLVRYRRVLDEVEGIASRRAPGDGA